MDRTIDGCRGAGPLSALQVARQLCAVIPLTIIAVAALVVGLLTMVLPSQSRRDVGIRILDALTSLATAIVRQPKR